jgi:hypothetical protein
MNSSFGVIVVTLTGAGISRDNIGLFNGGLYRWYRNNRVSNSDMTVIAILIQNHVLLPRVVAIEKKHGYIAIAKKVRMTLAARIPQL